MMTDKEIIINGIDVSGCSDNQKGNCLKTKWQDTQLNYHYTLCKDNPNCYYKQLERLEKENAELKAYKDVNEDFKKAWEELKVENERLIEGLGIANKYVNKYHQTLQEIKDIAEKECKDCLNKRTDSCWICPYYPILELITKAESEEV